MKIKRNHVISKLSGIDNSDDFQNWINSFEFIRIYWGFVHTQQKNRFIQGLNDDALRLTRRRPASF